eukprot:5107679-Amphidinium_carterae.1
MPSSPEKGIYIEIQTYSICETVSWMLGGYDEVTALMDNDRRPYEVGFGSPAKKFRLMDHIGMNKNPISPNLCFAELDWQAIIQ